MTNPSSLRGEWRRGWSVDVHTTSSQFLEYDEHGHPQFDTTRSELGELLYRLKYRGEDQNAGVIAEILADFLSAKPNAMSRVDAIVPVPPSNRRAKQPVLAIARELGSMLDLPVLKDAVSKTKDTPELKGVFDAEERRKHLDNAFKVNAEAVSGKGVLLVDDLYRSGATANAVTHALVAAGSSPVYFLAATRTRSNT